MAYLVHVLDEQGNFELIDEALLGLYPNLNQNELIALSEEQYQQFCEQNNGKSRFVNGAFIFEQPPIDEVAVLAQTQDRLIRQIAEKTDCLKSSVLVGYPQAEIDSFYRQESEARAWVVNNNTATPMLSAIAENRGVPLSILAQKVIEKADFVSTIMGHIIGTRQGFEDRILSAKNLEELTACEQEIEQWQLPNH